MCVDSACLCVLPPVVDLCSDMQHAHLYRSYRSESNYLLSKKWDNSVATTLSYVFFIRSCMLITKQSCNASQRCGPALQACRTSSQCQPPAQLSDGHVLPLLAACWACQAARRSCISVRRAAFAAASRRSASASAVTLFTHTHQSYTLSKCDALLKSQDMHRQSAYERPLSLLTHRCSRFQRRPVTPSLHTCQRFGRPSPDSLADLV